MSEGTLMLWIKCQMLIDDAKARLKELERGQGMVEYSLIITIVALALVGALFTMSDGIKTKFGEITNCLSSTPSETGC